jgi:hypothetical protein
VSNENVKSKPLLRGPTRVLLGRVERMRQLQGPQKCTKITPNGWAETGKAIELGLSVSWKPDSYVSVPRIQDIQGEEIILQLHDLFLYRPLVLLGPCYPFLLSYVHLGMIKIYSILGNTIVFWKKVTISQAYCNSDAE